jgi:hypothetical protein
MTDRKKGRQKERQTRQNDRQKERQTRQKNARQMNRKMTDWQTKNTDGQTDRQTKLFVYVKSQCSYEQQLLIDKGESWTDHLVSLFKIIKYFSKPKALCFIHFTTVKYSHMVHIKKILLGQGALAIKRRLKMY